VGFCVRQMVAARHAPDEAGDTLPDFLRSSNARRNRRRRAIPDSTRGACAAAGRAHSIARLASGFLRWIARCSRTGKKASRSQWPWGARGQCDSSRNLRCDIKNRAFAGEGQLRRQFARCARRHMPAHGVNEIHPRSIARCQNARNDIVPHRQSHCCAGDGPGLHIQSR